MSGRLGRAPLSLAVVAIAIVFALAPPAQADIEVAGSFAVSSVVFTLDGSGGVYVARSGAVDHYDSAGNALGGFTVPAKFTAPNDIVRAGSKLFAVDAGDDAVHSFDTDGSGQIYSTAADIAIPRALALDGGLMYVSAGETDRLERLSTFPVFGAFQVMFGWGVSDRADAFEVCASLCQIAGSGGPELGKVNDARGLAVDAAHNLYVSEQAAPNSRVEVYNSAPAPTGAIGSQGSAAGQLDNAQGIALDGAGHLFVADQYNNRISEFQTDGTFMRAFGVGVRTGAHAFETCTAATTCQQGIAAGGMPNHPFKVAYDGAGHLYVSDGIFLGAPARVLIFNIDKAAPVMRTLTVTTSGAGSGTVTGQGIDCGGAGHVDCSETVANGASVELTATPDAGSAFSGFSGGGCATASSCTVTLDADKSVDAAFAPLPPAPFQPPPAPRGVAPVITAFKITPAAFRAAAKGATISRKKAPIGGAPTGGVVSFKLSTAATATFRVTRKSRKKTVVVGSFTFKAKTGANKFTFRGRLKGKALNAGSYKLVAQAKAASGLTSKQLAEAFKIVTS